MWDFTRSILLFPCPKSLLVCYKFKISLHFLRNSTISQFDMLSLWDSQIITELNWYGNNCILFSFTFITAFRRFCKIMTYNLCVITRKCGQEGWLTYARHDELNFLHQYRQPWHSHTHRYISQQLFVVLRNESWRHPGIVLNDIYDSC